jgi:membrane protein implicated in regulation of membrane protease activity
VFVIYLGSLLFGGVLIAATVVAGADHGDVHLGDVDHGGDGGHDQGHANAWLSLFGIRFWSFGTAFFGLTGLVLRALGWPGLAPIVAGAVGVATGLGASATFRTLTRESIGAVQSAGALVGREGKLLLPVARGQRGKVRLGLPAGGDLDLLAESGEDEALDAGATVLVVEVKGNVAVVARAPAEPPAPRPPSPTA